MLTCADCPHARTLHPKADVKIHQPLNVLCQKHGTDVKKVPEWCPEGKG